MRIVATILGATAGFVFIAASAAMNWMFGDVTLTRTGRE